MAMSIRYAWSNPFIDIRSQFNTEIIKKNWTQEIEFLEMRREKEKNIERNVVIGFVPINGNPSLKPRDFLIDACI